MTTIEKQTTAGMATITVECSGCATVKAYLGGIEIGCGTLPLPKPSGELVARCGKLALTAGDMTSIETAIAAEKAAYEASPKGIAARARYNRMDRACVRAEQVSQNADINNLLRRYGQ
jgi:hypothetical protein